jgi:hypothetical protein
MRPHVVLNRPGRTARRRGGTRRSRSRTPAAPSRSRDEGGRHLPQAGDQRADVLHVHRCRSDIAPAPGLPRWWRPSATPCYSRSPCATGCAPRPRARRHDSRARRARLKCAPRAARVFLFELTRRRVPSSPRRAQRRARGTRAGLTVGPNASLEVGQPHQWSEEVVPALLCFAHVLMYGDSHCSCFNALAQRSE